LAGRTIAETATIRPDRARLSGCALEGRTVEQGQAINGIRDAVVSLETTFERRFEGIDRRFESIDCRFEALDAKVDHRFDILDAKVTRLFTWMVGLFVTTIVGVVISAFTAVVTASR
jgi:hypothetical protein